MSAPVKKNKQIKQKQRTSTTTIFVKMLSTDLVPVHNDIWRKLPFSSWRIMNPYFEEDMKVTEDATLTLTQKCFLPSSLQFKVANIRCFLTNCLHFLSPAPWILIWACLNNWSDINFGSMSSGAITTLNSTAFPAQGRLKQFKSLSRHRHKVSLYMTISPLIKLGGALWH